MTYVDFITPAIAEAKAATQADDNKEYEKALELYKKAINRFMVAIRHENKNPTRKKMLSNKVNDLLNRAEKIKKYCSGGKVGSVDSPSSPKSPKKGEEEEEDEGPQEEEEPEVDVPVPNPTSAFTKACCDGNIRTMKDYLERSDFDVDTNDNRYGLHYAAYYQKLEACKVLIRSGHFEIKRIHNGATVTQYAKDKIAKAAVRVFTLLHNELTYIIGLHEVKEHLYALANKIILDKKRELRGLSISKKTYDMIFKGNPGTGKTSIASLICKMYYSFEIIKKQKLSEVQRGDLVAGYIGKTALKTREVIEKQAGGMLLVDEAYRLSQGGEKDFGREAIEELMQAMNGESGIIFIFAGYEKDMNEYIKMNEGLFRRIAYHMKFQDFSPLEIAKILKIKIDRSEYKFADDVNLSVLEQVIGMSSQSLRSKMNGGMAQKMKEYAIDELNKGLSLDADGDDLILIRRHHLEGAMRRHFVGRD